MLRGGPITATGRLPVAAGVAGALLLLLAGNALAVRYASPTGSSGKNCQTPATACDLTTAIHGVPSNEPGTGEEVIVEPGTYNVAATITTGAPAMNVHGITGRPLPLITGSVTELLRTEQGATFADLEIRQTSNTEAIFAAHGTLERLKVIGAPSGEMLCQCYDGLIRNSIFIALPGSTAGAVGVRSNGGSATETLRNDTIYSESNEGPAIQLTQQAASGALTIEAFNTIAVNAAGGHDVSASKLATITMSHSDYASPGGPGTVTDAGGHVLTPPLLAGAPAGDFRELAGSLTIDAGIASAENGALDFAGNPRNTGAAPDIGAEEYQPPTPAPRLPTTGGTTTGGTTTGGPKAPTPPQITLASLNRSTFRAALRGAALAAHRAPVGATLGYRDSEAAITTISILGRETGHRNGRGCAAGKPRRHQRPCPRTRILASLRHADLAGANTIRISGRAGGRRLPAGAYTLTLTPSANGLTGSRLRLAFHIAA